jgi:hypothetical protein
LAASVCLSLVAHDAHATRPDLTTDEDAVALRAQRHARSWEAGRTRVFGAGTVDIGFLYLRPRFVLGWGRPHHLWVGIEANPTVAREVWGGYGGVRLVLPHLDVRVGARYGWAFSHDYLTPSPSIDRLTLEARRGHAQATTLETEANAQLPLGPGNVLLLASASYVTGVPDDRYVLEETLRAIVAPPWVLRARAGYAYVFGAEDQFSVAAVVDALAIPERRTHILRAGFLLRLAFSRSIELRGTFVPSWVSPDRIGLLDGDFTELGLRWRWATP